MGPCYLAPNPKPKGYGPTLEFYSKVSTEYNPISRIGSMNCKNRQLKLYELFQ